MKALLTTFAVALFSSSSVWAQAPGSFADGGNTLVSGMMLFLGNEEKVYIIDKAEGNEVQINGHPAWGAVWDIKSHQAQAMDIRSNVFCASGMHLPNGSWVTFGGNGAIGPGGNIGSVRNNQGGADFDAVYQNFDGGRSIRILNPCKSSDNFASPECQWHDPSQFQMKKRRWYSAAEPLGDGTVVLIGGFVNGGYVNRNFPNIDPTFEGGAAEPTFEFFPPRDGEPAQMAFMTKTSGLNSYAHTFLMPSGNMFVQANISTIMWDVNANVETPLPDMPGGVARVYPASGAVAMLPLTPENDYVPTVLFCGGSDMPPDAWGNYSNPAINTWEYPASSDCQRITPEPKDGSAPVYVKDDDMPKGRTMGQFIILPDGKLLVVNGGANGTAGYADKTGQTPTLAQMPFGMSLASDPVLTPSIYDPKAAAGKRWSSAGLSASTIPRLYHSSAILLPDASVLIAGSNPNVDVNLTTVYPTTYKAEVFYPPYFNAKIRPEPKGLPETLSYGGNPFDITIPSNSYSGSSNDAAEKAIVSLVRGGFTTHAMNMGQRFMQLKTSFTIKSDGSFVLHVAQPPPNANIFQPGPALIFVVINGVPSVGSMVIVGNGQIGVQPTLPASVLPASVRLDSASGSADSSKTNAGGGSTGLSTALIAGIIAGAVAVIGILGAVFGICIRRRKRAAATASAAYPMSNVPTAAVAGGPMGAYGNRPPAGYQGPLRNSESAMPLHHQNASANWSSSAPSLSQPYRDDPQPPRSPARGQYDSAEFDPYYQPRR